MPILQLTPGGFDRARNFFSGNSNKNSNGEFNIDASPKKDPIKAEGDQVTGAIDFDIEAPDSPAPLNVVFCIDRSGSMSGNPIQVARQGLIDAAKKLGKNDYFGVVSFGSNSSREVSPTKGTNASSRFDAISNIQINGGTDIMCGLRESKQMLSDMPRSQAAQWIVLISDGGSSINEATLKREYADDGITIHAAGILNYKQRVIQTVAEKTQGEWEDVGNPSNLGRFFKQKIAEARGVVALDPELRLDATPISDIKDVYYTHGDQQSLNDPDWDRNGCTVELSDLTAEKPPKVRLDIFVDGEAELEPQKIVDIELRTKHQNITDILEVEIAAPIIAEEENDEESGGRESLAVADVMETALEQGPAQAKRKLAEWEDDEAVNSEALSEAEQAIEEMEESGDEKEARDNASRVLSNWDED